MGAVYLATDPAIDRLVALKLMRTTFAEGPLRDRFTREARAVGRLHHPNIVTIFEFGEHGNEPFIAMEYVEGQTLSNLIGQTEITLPQQLAIIDGLCAGLHYAHRAGIIHRDIKPVNVMVDNEGIVKILDFGIARAAALTLTQTATQPGTVLGTLNYMSPEQLSGKAVDQRSDIFAVGAVFYEMLAGRQAFPGNIDTGILQLMLITGPTPLSTLRPDLDPAIIAIVNRCLERDAARRYPDLGEMRKDLAGIPRSDPSPRSTGATVILPQGGSPSSILPLQPRTPSPETLDAMTRARQAALDAEISAAVDALEREEYTRATEAYQRVLDANPSHPGALALQAQLSAIRQARGWVAEAQAELGRGALTSASVLLDRALAARPGMPEGLRLKAAIEDARLRTLQVSASAPTVLATPGAPVQPTPPPRAAESTIMVRPVTAAPSAASTPPPAAVAPPVATKRSVLWPTLSAAVLIAGAAAAFFLLRGSPPRVTSTPDSAAVPTTQTSPPPAPVPAPTASTTPVPPPASGPVVQPPRSSVAPTPGTRPETGASATQGRNTSPATIATPPATTTTPEPASAPPTPPPTPPVSAEPPPDPASLASSGDLSMTTLRGAPPAVRGREAATGSSVVMPFVVADRQCKGGNPHACTEAGLAERNGRGVARNDALAVGYYQRGCDGGDPFGCVDLGVMLQNGFGIARDDPRAATLFQRGCDGNVPAGCAFLGTLYQMGRGVTRDPSRALTLYVKGCDENGPAACNDAAMLMANGLVGPRDDQRIAGWLDKACGSGFLLGCRNLGILYAQGRGVARNESRAIELFRRGCDGKLAVACTNLGQMFETGRGVPKSEAEAKTFYGKACDLGDVTGCRLRDGG